MIESLQNSRVKYLVKLKDKKTREENNEFLVEGIHLVNEALKKGYLKEVFILKDNEYNFDKVTHVSKEVMMKITSLTNIPKIVGICKYLNEEEINGNVLVLDDIKDPGNLGTIIRSAAAFNYHTIILSKESVSVYNPKVIRATEGMLFHINIITKDLKEALTDLKNKNYLIYGTDVKEGKTPLKNPKKHALIIGSEARGINKDILKFIDQNLYIKMNDKVESLNAAISASILMHELNK